MLFGDFLATSTSSILANVVTHPFESVKVHQQLSGNSMMQVLRSQTLRSLYAGFSASVARAVISGGGRQTIYYGLKSALLSNRPRDESSLFGLRVALGMGAGLAAALLAAPVDMARTRQQSAAAASKKNVGLIAVLRDAYRAGGFRGLFRGSSAVFARQVMLNGSQLATFDYAKAFCAKSFSLPSESVATQVSAAALSGIACTVCVAPIEAIKTQMQVSRMSMREASSFIWSNGGGIRGFWRGSIALWIKLAPHTVIVLTLTDTFRSWLNIPEI